jgi:hypothetical protein
MSQNKIKFVKAMKYKTRLRLCLDGLAKSGKTRTALKIATELGRLLYNRDPRIALLDSEGNSALKYADEFEFDHTPLESCSPEVYIEAIDVATDERYDFLIFDSLSHEWIGKDGALAKVDQAAKRSKSGNQFFAWSEVTPLHNALIEAIQRAPLHLIATLRVKPEWVVEPDGNGKMVPRKIGLAAVQREGLDYEFDHSARMTLAHEMVVEQTACHELEGGIFKDFGAGVPEILASWLTTGAEPPPRKIDAQKLINVPRVKALFDQLRAPHAKRIATATAYPDVDTLVERLEGTLRDNEKPDPRQNRAAPPKNGAAHRDAGRAPAPPSRDS